MTPVIISEVKTKSPFGFRSKHSWDELLRVALSIPGWVAVHTDPRWGGSLDCVSKAQHEAPDRMIVAKGLHPMATDVDACVNAGAQYVLVVGWPHPVTDVSKLLVEPRSLAELAQLQRDAPWARAVWNARDLETGGRKKETFAEARAAWKGWLCQASFLRTVDDVEPSADAVLIGEHLHAFHASLAQQARP